MPIFKIYKITEGCCQLLQKIASNQIPQKIFSVLRKPCPGCLQTHRLLLPLEWQITGVCVTKPGFQLPLCETKIQLLYQSEDHGQSSTELGQQIHELRLIALVLSYKVELLARNSITVILKIPHWWIKQCKPSECSTGCGQKIKSISNTGVKLRLHAHLHSASRGRHSFMLSLDFPY